MDEPNYTIEIKDSVTVKVPKFNEDTDDVDEEDETRQVTLKMQVWAVQDKEDLYAVEFTKIKGNLIDFHKAYNVYRDQVLAPAIKTHKLDA